MHRKRTARLPPHTDIPSHPNEPCARTHARANPQQAKSVAYEMFVPPYRNVYSLLEIEHCVLRGCANKPRIPIAGLFLPNRDSDDVKWDMCPTLPQL